MCLKLIPWVIPLNAGELKALEGTHGTKPMGLLGREVGLEKHTKKSCYIGVKFTKVETVLSKPSTGIFPMKILIRE